MSNDLFAPPSKEELQAVTQQAAPNQDLFAPPTKEEMAVGHGSAEPPGLLRSAGNLAMDVGKAGVGLLAKAGKKIDSYTGAPVRAGIGAAQDGRDPIEAAKAQFGEDSDKAPTGKQIVMKAGVGDQTHLSDVLPALYTDRNSDSSFWDPRVQRGGMLDPSAADAAGAVMNVATDPLTYIPGGTIAKGAKGVADTEAGSKAVGLLGKAGTKVGHALTGVPEKEIETYAKSAPEIQAMSKASANDVGEAANTISSNLNKDIRGTKQTLNNQISQTLSKMPTDQTIETQPIFNAIDAQKSRVNAKLNPEKLDEIDAIKDKIKRVTTDDGKISVQDLNDVKNDLQEMAKGSYAKNGQIFQMGRDGQQAAKSGAAQARKILNSAAPEVADANNQLAKLHAVDRTMNRNLLVEDKSAPGLLSAGSGGNPRNMKSLQRLGDVTGTEPLNDAEKLASMRTFGSPQLLPIDSTGKSVLRMGLGAKLGGLIGENLGVPYHVGEVAGGAATSPLVLKYGIDAGRFAGKNAKNAEKTGLLLDQLSHQGQGGNSDIPPGLLLQTRTKKKDQDKPKNN